MGEPRKHDAEWKQPDACYMNLVIDEMFKTGKPIEQKVDKWLLGTRGWGCWWLVAGGGVLDFFLAWWKYFEITKWWWLCDSTDMIKTLYFGVGFFLACEFYLFLKYPLRLMQLWKVPILLLSCFISCSGIWKRRFFFSFFFLNFILFLNFTIETQKIQKGKQWKVSLSPHVPGTPLSPFSHPSFCRPSLLTPPDTCAASCTNKSLLFPAFQPLLYHLKKWIMEIAPKDLMIRFIESCLVSLFNKCCK